VAKLLRNGEHLQAILDAESDEALYAVLTALSEGLMEPEAEYAKKLEEDPEFGKMKDAHADLMLLARLQLCQEMYETAKTGKRAIKQRIESIRMLIDPRLLKHYDRVMLNRGPALVPVEGDTCQGCFMKLPSQYAQIVRQDTERIHTCKNCSRFIYMV
jgi:hypothetical protein